MAALCVMLVAAEASSDVLGANLARALKRRLGDRIRFCGVGGPRMVEAGVASPFDIADISIVGILEGVRAYPRIRRRVADTVAVAERERPDVAVLIDSWGFTIRVAAGLRALEHPPLLVKYVGPQVWAWRSGRANVLAHAVDHLLSTQSMDAPYYAAAGLPSTFVGNPMMVTDFASADGGRLRAKLGIPEGDPILLVLPGSRHAEIRRLMNPFEDAVRRLKAERPNLHVVVPAAPTVRDAVSARVASWPFQAHLVEGEEDKFDAMKAGTVALAASGTVTTELGLAGCPVIVGYKVDLPTYLMATLLVRLKWITLMNIAAKDTVAPEYLQGDCTGPNLADAVAGLLDDPGRRAQQIERQNAALEVMGRRGPDPAEAAADVILKLVAERKTQ